MSFGLRGSVLYVTQLSIRIRLTVGLWPPSDRLMWCEWKSGRCWCSSRSLPTSWELHEELTLSAGDLPVSARADEEPVEWGWAAVVWAWPMYTDWPRWSRGGEIGSALTLTLWLVPPGLQKKKKKEDQRRSFFNLGVATPCRVRLKCLIFFFLLLF